MMLTTALAAPPTWSDLPPWRTLIVVDDVSLEREWFAMPMTPGRGERCEVGLLPSTPNDHPVVHCGPAQHSDVGRRELPRSKRRYDKAAREALLTVVGPHRDIRTADMEWIGRMRRVSFRQVVITEPHKDPALSRTFTHASFWDVDLDTGRVDRGVLGSRVAEEALCSAGKHAHCADRPRLLEFVPQAGWDGHLIDVEAEGSQAEQTKAIEEQVRQIALSGSNEGVAMRAGDDTMLPKAMDAGMSMRISLDVQRFDGRKERHDHTLDVPLNQAAFGGVAMSLPIDGTEAVLRIDAQLEDGGGQLKLRLGAEGVTPEALVMPLECRLVVDGTRAAAVHPCPVQHMLRQLTWVGDGGVQQVTVTAGDRLLPMLGPSQGPSLR